MNSTVDGPWFENSIDSCGVDFVHTSGPQSRLWFPEVMGGGVALFDYDNDGDLDLYLVQSGDLDPAATNKPNSELYRNRGDGTFEDVTSQAGVGATGYGMGCACGDYDNDGDVDLYVTNVGPNILFRNNGDGSFTDVSETMHVADNAWGASAAFVDYDSDGFLDLYVVNYINWSSSRELQCYSEAGTRTYCSPNNYTSPAPGTLYHNDGGKGFTDVSDASGIRKNFGNGLGIACADYNGDGRVDIFIANDGMANQLWINEGNGHFVDQALLAGCAVSIQGKTQAGMGVHAADFDNDGDADLFVTHLQQETNTLFMNQGGWFDDRTAASGLGVPSTEFTGFGTGFADFDNDGRLDLYVVNGRVTHTDRPRDPRDAFAEPSQLYTTRDSAAFVEVKPRGGTERLLLGTSRGAAFGDIDNDGDVDIVVANRDARPHVLRNIAGSRGTWITFRVLNEHGGDAINARVRIESEGKVQWRTVQTAYSYCASNDPRVHFGLGGAGRAENVQVLWPDGRSESFGALPSGAIHVLRRGAGG